MFKNPDIDRSKSIQMIIHVLKLDNEYSPALELVFPDEDSLTLESLFAMRDAVEFAETKIERAIDRAVNGELDDET